MTQNTKFVVPSHSKAFRESLENENAKAAAKSSKVKWQLRRKLIVWVNSLPWAAEAWTGAGAEAEADLKAAASST